MNNIFQISKTAAGWLMVGFLLLMLQGCQKPFIEVTVDTRAQVCEKGADGGSERGRVEGCPAIDVPAGGGTFGGTQCNSGKHCLFENATYFCARGSGEKCKTVDPSGNGQCACQCQP